MKIIETELAKYALEYRSFYMFPYFLLFHLSVQLKVFKSGSAF